MTLGLLVTRDGFKEDIIGLTRAAVNKGHHVIIFFTDDGVRLALDTDGAALKELEGVNMSLCDHSAKQRNVEEDSVPEGITCGSQYQNAVLQQDSDKVITI